MRRKRESGYLKIKELKNFEREVVKAYGCGEIRSPVHLSGGNEKQLIKIFEDIRKQDWIFTTYRSHYHALLKGMPKEELMKWIKENKSIHLMNKKYKIVSSAIVGGTLSQAVGCAMAIKRKNEENKKDMRKSFKLTKGEPIKTHNMPHVWTFCGDMTATLGVFSDCHTYSVLNDLPITFVIEDNGLSTDTPTANAWGTITTNYWFRDWIQSKIINYKYKRIYPHYGTGKRIKFT